MHILRFSVFAAAVSFAPFAFCASVRGAESVKRPAAGLNSPASRITAYSMVTRDGRRLVSYKEGRRDVFSLVHTNALPAGLPPVRRWTIYGVKSAHSDLGLHRSNYIQRKGTVARIEKAKELFLADKRGDDDPAAMRWVMEGWWSFINYPADRGEKAARGFITEFYRRGRTDVGGNWCGSTTHIMGYEELCRSLYLKREMEEKWGVYTKTAQIVDNPGVSSALIGLYADAGIRYFVYWPNAYSAGLKGRSIYTDPVSRDRPAVFWWESPDGESRVLVWTNSRGYVNAGEFGLETAYIDRLSHPFPEQARIPSPRWKPDMKRWEQTTARRLREYEKALPYDIWLFPNYHDDEMPSTRLSDAFAAWNEKWETPVFRTVGRLDEPLGLFEKKWGARLPVVKGDFTCAWDRAIPAFAEIYARKLAADRALPVAEARATIACARKAAAYPKDDFTRAYEALQLTDDHSYGFSGYSGRRCYDTWAQHLDWLETAERTVARHIPAQDEPVAPGILCRDGVTENSWYRLVVTNGVIYSMFDKELGRELLAAPANRLLYTRDIYKTWSGPETLRADSISSKVFLASDRKAVLVENRIVNVRDLLNTDRFKRYGHYAFPFKVENPRFFSQLNGPVVDAFSGIAPHTANSFSCVRDWCCVENGAYGVALVQKDTSVTEFGIQHGERAYRREKTPRSSSIYSLVFGDGLQWHLAGPPSFKFRYVITSYAGDWKKAGMPAFAARETRSLAADAGVAAAVSVDSPHVELVALKVADDAKGYIVRVRETAGRAARATLRQNLVPGARYVLTDALERDKTVLEGPSFDIKPFAFATMRITKDGLEIPFAKPSEKWTGLIVRPRAFAGGLKGQLYLLWGAEDGVDEYELYRDGKKIAVVKRETEDGIKLMNVRYDDRGLEPGREYEYRVRPVLPGGAGKPGAPFRGKTRSM